MQFHQSGIIFGLLAGSGVRLGRPSCATNSWRTDITLQTPTISLARKCGQKVYIGPYEIEKVIKPSVMRLKLLPVLHVHSAFHVSLLKPVSTSGLCPPAKPPRLIDDHPAYTVRRLLDVQRRGRRYQYLVDWEGYGLEEWSWISHSLILDPDLLVDFYLDLPDKPGRLPSGIH